MFYVVQKGKNVDQAIGFFENFITSQHHAEEALANTGCHHLVIEMRYLWTTQTIGDALREDESVSTPIRIPSMYHLP